jgi:DNA-binding CsgD family transcriptional regulator
VRTPTSDPLAIVEAGYDLNVDDAAWVARITQAVSREIVGPLGTVGYRFQQRQLRYVLEAICVANGAADLARSTANVVAALPFDDLARFYAQRGIATTHESCRAALPPQVTDDGIIDFCGVVIGEGANGVAIGAPLPVVASLPTSARRRWRSVSAHLSAVFRLRGALSRRRQSNEDALFTPSGHLLHATGTVAGSREAQRLLRDAALAMEKARGPLRRQDPGAALDLWRELIAGRWTIVDRFESCGRRLLVAHENVPEAAPLRELSPPQHTIVRKLLEGLSLSRIAADLGTTPSTVTEHLRQVLRKLRLRSASELATFGECLKRCQSAPFELQGFEGLLIDAGPSCDAVLRHLSVAERKIAGLVLDGLSTAEIAELRRCAYRTVANQLASLYEKLGVSSRVELGAYVAKLAAKASALEPRALLDAGSGPWTDGAER